MKYKIIFFVLLTILMISSGCTANQISDIPNIDPGVECPRGVENDPFPGQCGQYTDKDNNDICDLSE